MPGLEESELVSLAIELMDIPSVTGQERAVFDRLSERLVRLGFRLATQTVEGDRYNLVATLTDSPDVLLCTHLDTVGPWVAPRLRDGVLYGRGACDAKGIAAAMVSAAAGLAGQGVTQVGLLFVVGEETDSRGAKVAARSGLSSRFVVVGEPTGNRLALGQKGVLSFRLQASGRSGHSADPTAGPSAIDRLLRVLNRLASGNWPTDPVFGATTLNIGRLGGGSAANVVAHSATAEAIFRLAVPVDLVRQRLEAALEEGVELEVVSASDPMYFHVVPGFPTCVVSFGSDAPYLSPVGKVLMLGPGSIQYAHRPDEQVSVSELTSGAALYMDLVRSLLDRSGEESRQ
jgi:acetylornithine deacetylase